MAIKKKTTKKKTVSSRSKKAVSKRTVAKKKTSTKSASSKKKSTSLNLAAGVKTGSVQRGPGRPPGNKGGKIVTTKNGQKVAIIPRNSYAWLNSVIATNAKPSSAEFDNGSVPEKFKGDNVYVIDLGIPMKAFPENPNSAPSMANNVRTSLESAKIIKVLREGNAHQRAIIKINVDEIQEAISKQGITASASKRSKYAAA